MVVVVATASVGCSCWVSGENEGPLLGFFGLMVERRELSMFWICFSVFWRLWRWYWELAMFVVFEYVKMMDFYVFSSLFVSFLLLGCWF